MDEFQHVEPEGETSLDAILETHAMQYHPHPEDTLECEMVNYKGASTTVKHSDDVDVALRFWQVDNVVCIKIINNILFAYL